MSVFKDDIGFSNSLQKIQKNFFQPLITREVSGAEEKFSEKEEDFEKISLSENAQKKQDYDGSSLESLQERKNLLETANNHLDTINSHLEKIRDEVKKESEKSSENKSSETKKIIGEHLQKIQDILDNTTFNNKKVFDDSYDDVKSSIKNDKIINVKDKEEVNTTSKEEEKNILQKVNEVLEENKKKQQEISKEEEKIVAKVDSTIEFELTASEDPSKSKGKDEDVAAKLKDSAIKSIAQNPQIAKQAQIEPLDEKIILALVALTRINN